MDWSLLRPLWLAALPLLALAALLMLRRRARIGDWEKVVDPALMAALRALGQVDDAASSREGIAAMAAAALVVLALAGPAVERRDAIAFRNLDGVVFVLDASPSATRGETWTPLQTAGRVGVAALGSRPAGLVVFAGDAYVANDMTADSRQLGLTMSLVGADTVPDRGSRPALGLALARQLLAESDVLAGDVVLLTDGGGLGPETMTQAAEIAARGARLTVVMPETTAQSETLAAAGGGQAFSTDQSGALASFLRDAARDRLEKQDYPLLFRSDMGRFLLVFAMLPVLLLFGRGRA